MNEWNRAGREYFLVTLQPKRYSVILQVKPWGFRVDLCPSHKMSTQQPSAQLKYKSHLHHQAFLTF